MRRMFYVAALAATMAGTGFAVCAGATSVVRFAFGALCTKAETIAHVRCEAVEYFQYGKRGDIFTRTRLKVLDAIKGSPGTELMLTLPGGRVDGRRLAVPGIPQFIPGEETVIFLSQPGAFGSPWPVGLRQGCYRVRREAGGERQVVMQPGITPVPEGYRYKPTSSRAFAIPLPLFFREVRRMLAPQAAEP